METRGSFNRLEWLLGIILIILLIIVAVLSLVFWFRPESPGITAVNDGSSQNSATVVAQQAGEIGPTAVYSGHTAKLAYVSAEGLAKSWQEDAALLNATATWSQGATVSNLQSGQTTWAFTFYSPSTQRSTTISVVDNQTTFIGEGVSPIAYTLSDVTGWQLDSNQAIQILLDQGGYNFINQEGITILTMALMLDDGTPSSQMEWLTSLIGTESGNSLDLRINATTGEILEISNIQ